MPRKSGTHDATAVARCLSGDQAAFGELVKRYQGLAVAVAFSICHERSLAEDVAQDAFVMAYRKLKQLARHESFCAWLVNIVRNAALRSAHNVARREEVHKLASADTRPHTEDPAAALDVAELLARVDDESQRVLNLKYLHGMTCSEIASTLGVPIGTVTSKISRALATLRAAVSREQRRWPIARDSRS